jgi:hypothetical protein
VTGRSGWAKKKKKWTLSVALSGSEAEGLTLRLMCVVLHVTLLTLMGARDWQPLHAFTLTINMSNELQSNINRLSKNIKGKFSSLRKRPR